MSEEAVSRDSCAHFTRTQTILTQPRCGYALIFHVLGHTGIHHPTNPHNSLLERRQDIAV